MKSKNFIPLHFKAISYKKSLDKSKIFFESMYKRRSIRHFSTKNVSREVIENIIKTASTAPSGAHKQPWNFCAISNKELKKKIRDAAEKEEKLNYEKRMSETWLKDLEPLNTDWQKPMLEDAPWLIVVFMKTFNIVDGEKYKNYYVKESVGLATGFLLAAIHQAGLCSLTHTPSPMGFLAEVLQRPSNEKAFLLIPVAYPTENCEVPLLERKKLEEVSIFFE
ncbi:MAG: nitroreductase family protein [Chitinophagales bacterium]